MAEKKKDPRTALSKKTMQELEKRTRASLAEKHRLFRQEHKMDSDEQLLEYVRKCAETMGYSPNAGEVIGSAFIAERIGSNWSQVLQKAGLPPVVGPAPPLQKRYIFKKEYKAQTKIYRQEKRSKAAKKEAKHDTKAES